VILLFSADTFFESKFLGKCSFLSGNPIEIDPMVTNVDDIQMANILRQANLTVAIPLFDEDFQAELADIMDNFRLNCRDMILDLPKDKDFEVDSEYYNTTEDEEFGMSVHGPNTDDDVS